MSMNLTADDIRDLIERHSEESGGNRRDFNNGAYGAIADELNATLGNGKCEDVSTRHGFFTCSECGCTVEEEGVGYGGINFCPDCGSEVER